MDCCGEYRYGAGAGWECAPYSQAAYAPYAHYYAPHAHDPYSRYNYRYDYGSHLQHVDHSMSMDYGGYASKEMRARRCGRQNSRARTPASLPLPPTPPLECGFSGRSSYYEAPMWQQYQMNGMSGGWSSMGSAWPARPTPCREQARYPSDYASMKSSHYHPSQMYPGEGRSTPYSMYEDGGYEASRLRRVGAPPPPEPRAPLPSPAPPEPPPPPRAPTPPPEKKPATVPLPAFQQAFGSTEIGKFAEAFTRTEVALGDTAEFSYESFTEWETPLEPQWPSQPTREIKCENNF